MTDTSTEFKPTKVMNAEFWPALSGIATAAASWATAEDVIHHPHKVPFELGYTVCLFLLTIFLIVRYAVIKCTKVH